MNEESPEPNQSVDRKYQPIDSTFVGQLNRIELNLIWFGLVSFLILEYSITQDTYNLLWIFKTDPNRTKTENQSKKIKNWSKLK